MNEEKKTQEVNLLDVDLDAVLVEGKKKSKKKWKKLVIAAVALIVVVIAVVIFYQHTERETAYQEAITAQETGDYEKAVSLFEELGDYKDSKEQMEAAKAFFAVIKRADDRAEELETDAIVITHNFAKGGGGDLTYTVSMRYSEEYISSLNLGESNTAGWSADEAETLLKIILDMGATEKDGDVYLKLAALKADLIEIFEDSGKEVAVSVLYISSTEEITEIEA